MTDESKKVCLIAARVLLVVSCLALYVWSFNAAWREDRAQTASQELRADTNARIVAHFTNRSRR